LEKLFKRLREGEKNKAPETGWEKSMRWSWTPSPDTPNIRFNIFSKISEFFA
jgi:hypothetical protein